MKIQNSNYNFAILIPVVCLMIFSNLTAQSQNNIKIRLIDKQTNNGVPYTYVYEKSQSIGYSDSLGYFSINIPAPNTNSDSLFFSSVGYMKIGYPINYLIKNEYNNE